MAITSICDHLVTTWLSSSLWFSLLSIYLIIIHCDIFHSKTIIVISSAICQQILSSLWSLSRWSLPSSSPSSLIFDQENAGIWRTSQLILFGQRSTNKCNSLSTNQDSEDVVDDGDGPGPLFLPPGPQLAGGRELVEGAHLTGGNTRFCR